MTEENSAVAPFTQLAEDYSLWFSQVLRAMFYPKDISERPHPPVAVDRLSGLQERLLKSTMIERLKGSQDSLHTLAEKILSTHQVPALADFDTFWQSYEGFSTQLQRIEKDMLLSDFGIDLATGLRSASVMMVELARELERRSRKGQPFSVAMLRVDDPSLHNDDSVLGKVSKAIVKTIRSFDDAYVSGSGEFLISLKHSDTAGGVRFVARFNQALSELDVKFTVSSCVAEPLPGDELDDLLANVRADLDQISGMGSGAVGQYEEISPLNRFLQGMKDKKE